MVPQQHQLVAAQRQSVEQQKGPALAPVIGQPASRVGVDRAQESLQAVEETNNQHPRAQDFQILGRKTEPQTFTGTRQDQRREQERRVPPQGQELGEYAPHKIPTSLSGSPCAGRSG
jgi:hypothetical protein